ncbi:uncharacterized protein G2W53_033198 [Senna tora]|uniref:Uncharacterized protein n=1 Tax=Senna tora TaxID=362788 RepID=A0A834T1S4_9FABA|nr:uncharacterized protein G2W53_033198 [Senna tora]
MRYCDSHKQSEESGWRSWRLENALLSCCRRTKSEELTSSGLLALPLAVLSCCRSRRAREKAGI